MTVGYRNAAGVDFDSLFDPFISGSPPGATGFRDAGGTDLAGRYAPIAFGTKGPDVGFRNGAGVDVSNLWAAIGTASYAIAGLQGKNLGAGDAALTNQPTVLATVACNINNNGTWSVSGGNSHGSVAQPAPTSGTWLPAGSSVGEFEVLFDLTSTGHASRTTNNSAPVYTAIGVGQGVSLTLPSASGATGVTRNASFDVRCRIRRIATGAVISDTTFGGFVSTTGYL